MFDTHTHLNFKRFKKTLPDVITEAKKHGVNFMVVPGTDEKSSRKSVEISMVNENIYSAIGVHPHHVFDKKGIAENVDSTLEFLRELIGNPEVVAVGEIGLDRHEYEETVYEEYHVDSAFMDQQMKFLEAQVRLGLEAGKSVIFHNREAKDEMLPLLDRIWDDSLRGRSVFHCCEADLEILEFAKAHKMFIGVDGDVTYGGEKAEFMKHVPLEMLVVETDSPFLLPEPLRSEKLYPNVPANLRLVIETVAQIKGVSFEEVEKVTEENGLRLFNLRG